MDNPVGFKGPTHKLWAFPIISLSSIIHDCIHVNVCTYVIRDLVTITIRVSTHMCSVACQYITTSEKNLCPVKYSCS